MAFRIKTAGFIFWFLVGLVIPVTVYAAEFNDKQRSEMGEIIKEYLLKNPSVLRDAFINLEKQEKQAQKLQTKKAIKENAEALFGGEGDLVVGNPKGRIAMVEFFDYNCGFCKRALPDVIKLAETQKDVKMVIKEFPILGPGSVAAARAAMASEKQGKYWEFHKALLKRRGSVTEKTVMSVAKEVGLDIDKLKKDMKSGEIATIITRNMALAQMLGINGTPAFLVDDQLFPGAVGFDLLADAIENVRKTGCNAC